MHIRTYAGVYLHVCVCLCLCVASLSVEKHFDSNGNESATRPEVASESFSVGQCQAGTRLSHEEQSISGGGAGIVAIVARRFSLMKKLQISAHKFISGGCLAGLGGVASFGKMQLKC